jgi:hypothetical protein
MLHFAVIGMKCQAAKKIRFAPFFCLTCPRFFVYLQHEIYYKHNSRGPASRYPAQAGKKQFLVLTFIPEKLY